MEICAGLLGTVRFDEEVFEKSVRLITAMPDGSLEIQYFNGETKLWEIYIYDGRA